MKKLFLFLMASGIAAGAFAQNQGAPMAKSKEEMKQDSLYNHKDADGKKTGLWKERVGTTTFEGRYMGEKKYGVWRSYQPDGTLLTVEEFINGKRDGISLEMKANGYIGKEAYYQNDLLEGKMKHFNNSGKPELEAVYKGGKLNGPKKVYYQSNKLQEESFYVDDKRDGVTRWFFEEGKPSIEYTYKMGSLEGVQKSFYKDGALESETMYKNNKMNGEYKEYYEDGKTVKLIGNYVDDKKQGTWKEFSKEGKVTKTEKYKNDVLAK
jgi:antitoxin component YwqK of YwqJK toxin-antitoxin module